MGLKDQIAHIRRGTLLRVLADILFVNLALAGALVVRFMVKLFWEGASGHVEEVGLLFAGFYYVGAPVLSALVVTVFNAFGIYTRTRFYARKHKAMVLLQAVTATYLLFIFCLYFISREITLVPRSVLVIAYLGTLALAGGTRLLKHFADRHYDIVPRHAASSTRIHRVLVVGGAGYIGSVFVRQLLARRYQVRVLDAAVFGNSAIVDLISNPQFEFCQGDLRHVESVVHAVQGCDAVVHLGAIVGDPACDVDAESTREINTVATKLLVQVCRGDGVRRLLFASTCAVYGASDHLMDERSEVNPVSLYARSKLDGERVILESRSADFCPVVLRIGTAFGLSYRPRFDLVVNLLVGKAWKDKKITIYNQDQWRPFVHVHDIARAFCASLEAGAEAVSGEVFNVGAYGMNQTLGQVAEKIVQLVPGTEVQHVETNDRRNYRVSFDKIHSYLGFSCERTLEDGIREIRDFLEREAVEDFSGQIFDNSKRMRELSNSWLPSGNDRTLEVLVGSAEQSH